MTIREKSLKWWGDTIKSQEHVVPTRLIPDQRQRAFLLKEGYMSRVARGFYLLKRPEDELEEVFPLLYWQAVSAILARYNWSIRSQSALMIHNGDERVQKQLTVGTKEKTNWTVPLPEEFSISLVYDQQFDNRLTRKIKIAGAGVPVDVPEKVLIDTAKNMPEELTVFIVLFVFSV